MVHGIPLPVSGIPPPINLAIMILVTHISVSPYNTILCNSIVSGCTFFPSQQIPLHVLLCWWENWILQNSMSTFPTANPPTHPPILPPSHPPTSPYAITKSVTHSLISLYSTIHGSTVVSGYTDSISAPSIACSIMLMRVLNPPSHPPPSPYAISYSQFNKPIQHNP